MNWPKHHFTFSSTNAFRVNPAFFSATANSRCPRYRVFRPCNQKADGVLASSDGNIRIHLKLLAGKPEVPRIKGYREIRRSRLFPIGHIDSRIRSFVEVRADRHRQVPARERNPSTPILCGSIWYGPHEGAPAPWSSVHLRAPSENSESRGVRTIVDLSLTAANAILQQHTRDPLGCQPVADLRAFQGRLPKRNSPAGKHSYRGALCSFPLANRPSSLAVRRCRSLSVPAVSVLGGGLTCASGGVPGHIGTCVRPGDGCQPGFWANRPLAANIRKRVRRSIRSSS